MKYLLFLIVAVLAAGGAWLFLSGDEKPPVRPTPPEKAPDPEDEEDLPDAVDWEREHRRRLTEHELKRWKEILDKENERRIAELKSLLALTAEQVKSVRTAFDTERDEYEKLRGEMLEHFGSKGISDETSKRYRVAVEMITNPTDNQMRYILDEEKFKTYSDWRKKYNEGRYFWKK